MSATTMPSAGTANRIASRKRSAAASSAPQAAARASPIRASSHAGLPRAFILTAEFDPLLDNGARYRDALAAAGVPVRYLEYPGAIHGFLSLPGVVPIARRALDDIVGFLRDGL